MNNLLISFAYMNFLWFLLVAVILTIIIIIVAKVLVKRRNTYQKKPYYLSPTELKYFVELEKIVSPKYRVIPQVNLATVVDKTSPGYRTELFRNIDFGIFTNNFELVLLIEINDNSHLKKDRIERDKTVNEICKKANLPLVTFWTRDGIDTNRIYHSIRKYL